MCKNIISVISVLLLLVGCGGSDFKSTLGLKKSAPDEFRVISNPPLSIPPEFNLEQPNRGVSKTMELKGPDSGLSREDTMFLESFEKEGSASDIKRSIDLDLQNKKIEDSNKGPIRKTFSKLNSSSDPYINPVSERERIKENIANGKPLNEGEVKVKSKSTLERIFD